MFFLSREVSLLFLSRACGYFPCSFFALGAQLDRGQYLVSPANVVPGSAVGGLDRGRFGAVARSGCFKIYPRLLRPFCHHIASLISGAACVVVGQWSLSLAARAARRFSRLSGVYATFQELAFERVFCAGKSLSDRLWTASSGYEWFHSSRGCCFLVCLASAAAHSVVSLWP